MTPEPKALRKLNREQRAEVHYARRAGWLKVRVRGTGAEAFGIESLSDPNRFYLCDGERCTCPDYRFHGLSGLRIGRDGAHIPCSHLIAVQRFFLNDAWWLAPGDKAAIAESH